MNLLVRYLTFLLLGTLLGFFAAIYLFAVDIDILMLPYINKPVKLTKDLTVQLDGKKISIQKGTQIVLSRMMPDQDVFSIYFTADWGEVSYEPDGVRKKYFRVADP